MRTLILTSSPMEYNLPLSLLFKTPKHSSQYFSILQEAGTKDIEHAFGVQQATVEAPRRAPLSGDCFVNWL